MFPIIYCPFLFGCRRSWLRWDLGFIFLWLMKSTLWPLHCTSRLSLISLPILENLSLWGTFLETAVWCYFSFTDKANEIISLAISSSELMSLLKPLEKICRILWNCSSKCSNNYLQQYLLTIEVFQIFTLHRKFVKSGGTKDILVINCLQGCLRLWLYWGKN